MGTRVRAQSFTMQSNMVLDTLTLCSGDVLGRVPLKLGVLNITAFWQILKVQYFQIFISYLAHPSF